MMGEEVEEAQGGAWSAEAMVGHLLSQNAAGRQAGTQAGVHSPTTSSPLAPSKWKARRSMRSTSPLSWSSLPIGSCTAAALRRSFSRTWRSTFQGSAPAWRQQGGWQQARGRQQPGGRWQGCRPCSTLAAARSAGTGSSSAESTCRQTFCGLQGFGCGGSGGSGRASACQEAGQASQRRGAASCQAGKDWRRAEGAAWRRQRQGCAGG